MMLLPASHWPLSTDWMPARMISVKYAASNTARTSSPERMFSISSGGPKLTSITVRSAPSVWRTQSEMPSSGMIWPDMKK